MPIIRYPGGNFVSGYNWLDGVGPKNQRPTVLERAWNSIETNQFGTNEFIHWAELVGTEPLLGRNFGTGTAPRCGGATSSTAMSTGAPSGASCGARTATTQPHNVKVLVPGQRDGRALADGHDAGPRLRPQGAGRRAADSACIDPRPPADRLRLERHRSMPTYLVWDREVLEECYDQVDAISLHSYYGNTPELVGQQRVALPGDESRHGAPDPRDRRGMRLRAGPHEIAQAAVAVVRRMERLVSGARPALMSMASERPRRTCWRKPYNLEDALLVGGFVNTLLRRCDRVRLACLAQIVNVIAPLVTNAEKTIRHTIYYPYAWALQYAHGRVLDLMVESETYPIKARDCAPISRATNRCRSSTWWRRIDPQNGQVAIFMLNRDTTREREVMIEWQSPTPSRVLACQTLTGPDLKAMNTFEQPQQVVPQRARRAGRRARA